jgi:ENTS family enterobactin (siderophore) exporter
MGEGTTGAEAGSGFRSALTHRDLRWFAAHHLVAGTGQAFGTVAVATAIYAQTGSATWVSAAAAARLVPYLVCSGLAGVLVDRTDRRRLLAATSAARAIVVLGVALAVAVEAHPALVVALVFGGTALGTGGYPAVLAVLPSTVPARDLPPATALVNTAETAVWLVGPALGGLAVAAADPAIALAANAAVFVLGAALLVPVAPRPAPASAPSTERSGILSELAAGAQIMVADPRVRCPLVLVVCVNVLLGAAPIALLVGSDAWFGGEHHYALLTAALGVGGFSGIVATNRLARRGDVVQTLTWTACLGCAPFLALLATERLGAAQLGASLLLVAAAGAAMVLTEVVALTVLLRELPEEVIGRVFGLVDSALVAAVLVGSVVAGPLIATVGLPPTLVLLGLVLPGLAVAGGRLGRPKPVEAAGGPVAATLPGA